MNHALLKKYAEVLLTIGVNLQKGQNLHIKAEPVHWQFINLLAEEAYKFGAKYVKVEADHSQLVKARVQHSDEAFLDYYPATLEKEMNLMVEEGWAMIYLDSMEDPHALDDIDQQKYATTEKARRKALVPFFNAIMKGKCPWTIAALPTPKWAAQILSADPFQEAERKLWELLTPILFLDRPNPVATWQKQSQILKERAKMLNEFDLSFVHFEGAETDLTVHLIKNAVWEGGVAKAEAGYEYLPNIPTYEVFTTPDCRKTQGRAQVTRPVYVLGSEVQGAWLEFSNGRVTAFGAQKGKELLEQFFSIDEKNRYLGEVALVDISSPIFQSNLLFHSILFDENAASHIALGRGISTSIRGGEKLEDKELEEIGCNLALQHIDFMIGSPEISVYGERKSGEKIVIIKDGEFVI